MLAQEPVDRIVVDCDDIVVSAEQMARLQELEAQGQFAIVPLSQPFLVQDLLSAIRSRPA